MKIIASDLKSAIADDGTVATCIRITRRDGVILGFTNHDITLTVAGVDYKPLPALERIVMKLRNNVELSNQDFSAAYVVDLSEEDLANGLYNEAAFDVLYVNWRDPSMGSVVIFSGRMGNLQWNSDGFAVDVFSIANDLNGAIGDVISAKCRHQLYSQIGDDPKMIGACGLTKVEFTGTVSTITTQKLIFTFSGFSPTTDQLANGVLTWTSGLNNGSRIEVKANTTGQISLFLPTDYLINSGDTFTVTPGCNKTIEDCRDVFNNIVNFGGFPIKGEDKI